MDTAKFANLFSCCPDRELLDFVAKPLGKGMTISKTLKPLICGEQWWRGGREGGCSESSDVE